MQRRMLLGEMIRRWRETEKIPLRRFAKMLGTSPSTLSRVERGTTPDGLTLARLLRYLLGGI